MDERAAPLIEKKVAVLHDDAPEGAPPDARDALAQAEAVSGALSLLGFDPEPVVMSLDLGAVMERLRQMRPCLVFNLVEAPGGRGRFIHFAPSLLDALGLPYTGANAEAMLLTSNKLLSKRLLRREGVPTPPCMHLESELGGAGSFSSGPWIVKSVWEHASIGLGDDCVVVAKEPGRILEMLERRRSGLGGECFAERFIDGREFNLSILAGAEGPEVLPPAEIVFDAYPPGKARVVGYRAKWDEASFEFQHTRRSFDFGPEDARLLARLEELALACWNIFGLSGYARVDFRVDSDGAPWVLEVNANPCISPDAGFIAAAAQRGLELRDVLERIVRDSGACPESAAMEPEADRVVKESQVSKVDRTSIRFRETPAPSDPAAVRSVVSSSGFFHPDEIDVAVELVETRLEQGEGSGYFFLFAERGCDLLGYTCFGPIPCTRESYDLYWIAVREDCRGMGLGRELFDRSAAIMAGRGGRRIYIETSSRDLYASTRAFYLRCGCREDAVLEDFYAPGDHKAVYVKIIA